MQAQRRLRTAGLPPPRRAYIARVPEPATAIPNTLAAVRDHTRVYRDFTYVYPVISRRSGGLSVGINLNPDKVCNFDCVYCEVDRKTPASRPGWTSRNCVMN